MVRLIRYSGLAPGFFCAGHRGTHGGFHFSMIGGFALDDPPDFRLAFRYGDMDLDLALLSETLATADGLIKRFVAVGAPDKRHAGAMRPVKPETGKRRFRD